MRLRSLRDQRVDVPRPRPARRLRRRRGDAHRDLREVPRGEGRAPSSPPPGSGWRTGGPTSPATSRCRWRSPERAAARFPGPPGKPAHPCRLNAGGVPVSLGPLGIWHPSQPAVLVGDPARLGTVGGAGLADRGGQVVAHGPLGQEQPRPRSRPPTHPSRAARSTSVSRAVSGESPATRLSAASAGSTTRSPACTRRTASASCRAGVSLTTNPSAPACSARRRNPGRPNVVTISTRVDGQRLLAGRGSPRCRPCPASPRRAARRRARARGGRRPRRRRRCPPRRPRPGRARGRAARPAPRAPGPGRRRAAAGWSPDALTDSSKPRGSRVRVTSTAPAAAARSRRPSSPVPAGHRPAGRCRRRGPRPPSAPAARCSGDARLCRITLVTPSRTVHANSSRSSEGTSSVLFGRSASISAARSASRARASSPGRVRSR